MEELEYKTKLGISDGQKFNKERIITPLETEYTLSLSIGPTTDLKTLQKLQSDIVKVIKIAGGQETLD